MNVADPVQWYQQLNDYAVKLNARAVKGYQLLLQRVAAGEVSPAQLQNVSSSYGEQHLPQHFRRLSILFFDLLNSLNDLYTSYQEEFLNGVLDSVNRSDQEAPFLLNLSAPLGETASASVLLTNTTNEPTIIRCMATDIRRADGVGPAFTPQITLAPDSLNLQPGEEGNLAVLLRLDSDSFDTDVLYVGTLQITGHGEPRFEIPLRIRAT
jgi:hypothetical protein